MSPYIYYFFQHDAACRVIARLKKEKDEAMMLLSQSEKQIPLSAKSTNAMVTNGQRGIPYNFQTSIL